MMRPEVSESCESVTADGEAELVALALGLGAGARGGAGGLGALSAGELALVRAARAHGLPARAQVAAAQAAIDAGEDPLGEAFCRLRSPVVRRPSGATYTPLPIVRAMVDWAAEQGAPARVVDPGAGSGRFVVEAGRRFPRARLIAVELDPLAALLTRAHLQAAGLGGRAEVRVEDYRDTRLPAGGRTLYIGNPPYVRHHGVAQRWKDWLTRTAAQRGHPASQLSGLHVHFFLATAEQAAPGDVGVFITAAEWLDVNYGALVRRLLLDGLGGSAVHVIEPTAAAFPDAATTAAITCFEVGAQPTSLRLRRVAQAGELGDLGGGRVVARERLHAASRWTPLTRATRKAPAGWVELGELCRVHRGQVTGANDFWIADGDSDAGLPATLLTPTVTRARELYAAGRALTDARALKRIIELPEDLDELPAAVRRVVDKLLARGRAAGVHEGYVAKQRRSWWSVKLREPAPILATYMARRAPGFVRNLCGARHINIAHGIYPRQKMTVAELDALAAHLVEHSTLEGGRTYAGGLTKFEPREMERLLVPGPGLLG